MVNGTGIGGGGVRIRPMVASSIEMKDVVVVKRREGGREVGKERDGQRAAENPAQPSLAAAIHSQSRCLTTVDIC